MSVQKKKDGRVFVVYREGGRQVWEAYGRGRQAEVQARARDLELKLAHLYGERRGAAAGPAPTLAEIAQLYVNARQTELAERTRMELLRLLCRPELADVLTRPAADLGLYDWMTVQNRLLAGGAGNRTVNTYFRYLSPIFRWAVAHQLIPRHPWRERVALKQPRYTLKLISLEDFARIIAAAPDHLAWAMQVAYYTGMRPGPSELFAARWDWVDWRGFRIRIYATKTGTWRWQYLPEAFVWRMLDRFVASRWRGETSERICTYNDRPIASVKTALAGAVAAAGVTNPFRLYDIRHLHITHALAGGAPIGDLAERVGHTDPTMIVRVYSHMVEDIRSKRPFALPKIAERN